MGVELDVRLVVGSRVYFCFFELTEASVQGVLDLKELGRIAERECIVIGGMQKLRL